MDSEERNNNRGLATIPCRMFSLSIISACNLPEVRKHFKMKVYAEVSFNGKEETQKKSPADKSNKCNPAWNYRVTYTIAEAAMQSHSLMLVIKLHSKRKLGDQYIGEVHMSLAELYQNASEPELNATLSLNVLKGSAAIPGAVLNISYSFGGIIGIKKPSRFAKALQHGVALAVRVGLISTVGIDLNIPISEKTEIIGYDM